MATYNTTIKQFVSSDAEFRAWFGHIRSALIALGWTQAPDTGQFDHTTMTYPGSNNATISGVGQGQIFKLNDTLTNSGGKPAYIRLQPGRGNQNGACRLLVSLSLSAPNGAGVFTGIESGQMTVGFGDVGGVTRTIADTTTYRCYCGGDGSMFALAFYVDMPGSTPYPTIFFIERSRNSDGTPNGDGVVMGFAAAMRQDTGTGGSRYMAMFPNGNFTPGAADFSNNRLHNVLQANWNITPHVGSTTATSLANGKVYGFPFYGPPPVFQYPLLSFMSCFSGDFPSDFSDVSLPLSGSNRTFKALGVGTQQPWMISNGNSALLIYYTT